MCSVKSGESVAKRDPKVFVINHKYSKRQQHEFDSLSVPLRHLPENLGKIKLSCPACSYTFPPAWFEKQGVPLKPVKPKYETKGVEYTGPARWILTNISQKCPRCGTDIPIELPVNKLKTRGSLFGDDAQRGHDNKIVFIYSLVGADQSLVPKLEKEIRNLKGNICSSKPPESWSLHMKELWSGGHRKKHPVFKELSFGDVINISNDLCGLIKEQNLFVYNIALCAKKTDGKPGSIVNHLKNEAYILLVLNAIDEWTSKNAQPQIFFDSEKKSQANETIHKWAQETFRGSQHSLLYGFIAKGIEIPEPKFVVPASHAGLEIADFVSYVIARYHLRKWQGKDIEIDPASMGLVTYLGYDDQGHLIWRRQEGYPWDIFYN